MDAPHWKWMVSLGLDGRWLTPHALQLELKGRPSTWE